MIQQLHPPTLTTPVPHGSRQAGAAPRLLRSSIGLIFSVARELWLEKLDQGDREAAWDQLIGQYHRLILASVRHYAEGYDEVMDLFAHVCESLRANDFARLRKYAAIPQGRVRFSTWLVAVVRNLVIDWFRHRHGRKQLDTVVAELPPVQREAFRSVFLEGRSLAEAYETTRTSGACSVTYHEFLRALVAAQRTVSAKRPGRLPTELAPGAARALVCFELQDAGSVDPPGAGLVESDMRRWLQQALEAVPLEDRIALQLYVIEGLSAGEVAELLGWRNAKTAYNRIYRSLSAVRGFLRGRGIQQSDLA